MGSTGPLPDLQTHLTRNHSPPQLLIRPPGMQCVFSLDLQSSPIVIRSARAVRVLSSPLPYIVSAPRVLAPRVPRRRRTMARCAYPLSAFLAGPAPPRRPVPSVSALAATIRSSSRRASAVPIRSSTAMARSRRRTSGDLTNPAFARSRVSIRCQYPRPRACFQGLPQGRAARSSSSSSALLPPRVGIPVAAQFGDPAGELRGVRPLDRL